MDPRLQIVDRRMAGVRRILAVTGGKGGIGKSSVAAMAALWLARRGEQVGLLDLDFCGPSTHVILGIQDARPVEDGGLVPAIAQGLRFMSIVHFADDRPAPLRGQEISNALIELLAITRWGDLDWLVIDMPPGFSDPLLDAARLLGRAEYLVVTTPSVLTTETVRKALQLFEELGLPVLGVVENMRRGGEPPSAAQGEPPLPAQGEPPLAAQLAGFGAPLLGAIPFDEAYEAALGDVERLAHTAFMRAVGRIMDAIAARHG